MKSVYWIRNDLRVLDNQALDEFLSRSIEGVALWFPTKSFFRAGPKRRNWILDGLRAFQFKLAQLGVDLYIFEQSFTNLNRDLKVELADTHWFFSREFTEEEIAEERLLENSGFVPHGFWQSSLIDPVNLPFSVDETPEVFTAFRKLVEPQLKVSPLLESRLFHPQIKKMSLSDRLRSKSIELDLLLNFGGTATLHPRLYSGEDGALEWLDEYFANSEGPSSYKQTRNGLLNWEDSTKFSPYLSTGLLSPQRIFWRLKQFEEEIVANDSTYWILFELLWRDYFRFLALKWGKAFFSGMSKRWSSATPRHEQEGLFQKWCDGETGQDFVDAHMIELNETGWMSNRGRQIVASFLAKSWGVDWKRGASYFEAQLIDYDPASNWGNWAYQAGVGQDPRDRVFNPERQAEIYDKEGLYRKRWLLGRKMKTGFSGQ